MREYETIVISRPDLAEEARKKIIDKVTALVAKGEGAVAEQNDWGVKRLAYRIKKCEKGFYTYLHYSQNQPTVDEIERTLRLEENVLKFITVIYEPKPVRPPEAQRRFEARESGADNNGE